MKRLLPLLLCLILIINHAAIAKAEETPVVTRTSWEISNVDLEHQSISIEIRKIDVAQDATLVLQRAANEDEKMEIPFSIRDTATTDTVSISLDDGKFLPSGKYIVYAYDSEGKKTPEETAYVGSHNLSLITWNVTAAPKRLTASPGVYSQNKDLMDRITVTIGTESYEATADENGKFVIDYPKQTDGTNIVVTGFDKYGCSEKTTFVIDDTPASIPPIQVCRNQILFKPDNAGGYFWSSDIRLCVSVNGETYYSDYGNGKNWFEDSAAAMTFPSVPNGTDTVTVWVESKSFNDSEKKEYKITDCEISSCNYSFTAYPAKAIGTVSANAYGQMPDAVSTVIGGVEYKADIDASGKFVLSYQEQSDRAPLTFTFYDSHGCSTTLQRSVYNPQIAGSEVSGSVNPVLPQGFTARKVPIDSKVVVEINGVRYSSEISTSANNQTVSVTYPKQTIGTKVLVWFEKENSQKSEVVEMSIYNKTYAIDASLYSTSLRGTIDLSSPLGVYNITSMYVIVDGQTYPCTIKTEEAEDIDGIVRNMHIFNVNFPMQKVGSTITLVAEDADGYTASKAFTLQNQKPKLTVKSVSASSKKVEGTTKANSDVTVQIGNKSYRAKATGSGSFSVNIKSSRRAGTKIKVSVVTPEGYTTSKSVKVVAATGEIAFKKNVYKTSKSVSLSINNGKKGDKVKLSVGSRTYTKKLKSDKKKQTVTISLKKKGSAGSNVKVVLYDKFGKKKASEQDIVYFGNTIYKGMSAKDAQLTTWGYPVRKNDWGTGSLQWVYQNGGTTLYVYITNGRVSAIQRLHY